MQVWILTFNRPHALNRLIHHFGFMGYKVNIFSNHPKVQLLEQNRQHVDKIIVNTLNCEESNSWCARSWNTIYMKGFAEDNELVCIQDDTDIGPGFRTWIEQVSQKYDFIWGPAGDQFHFIRKNILQWVGWWDERYIGCYAGDADYLKRVYVFLNITQELSRLSVSDSHNWGFIHNNCNLPEHVITTYESKTIDPDYDNQHWEFQRILGDGDRTGGDNPVIRAAQANFYNKWLVELDTGQPMINAILPKMMPREIDWYPWASKKFDIKAY